MNRQTRKPNPEVEHRSEIPERTQFRSKSAAVKSTKPKRRNNWGHLPHLPPSAASPLWSERSPLRPRAAQCWHPSSPPVGTALRHTCLHICSTLSPEAWPPSTYFTEAHRVSLGTGTLQGRRAGCQSSRNSLTSRDLPPLLCHQKRSYQGTSTQGGARVWPTDCPTEGLGA